LYTYSSNAKLIRKRMRAGRIIVVLSNLKSATVRLGIIS
jgi:hypothetical protein